MGMYKVDTPNYIVCCCSTLALFKLSGDEDVWCDRSRFERPSDMSACLLEAIGILGGYKSNVYGIQEASSPSPQLLSTSSACPSHRSPPCSRTPEMQTLFTSPSARIFASTLKVLHPELLSRIHHFVSLSILQIYYPDYLPTYL
jgi:hypothetical protein